MSSAPPPKPVEQTSPLHRGGATASEQPHGAAGDEVRADPAGDHSQDNLDQQGDSGNLRQNLTPQHKTQNR